MPALNETFYVLISVQREINKNFTIEDLIKSIIYLFQFISFELDAISKSNFHVKSHCREEKNI